MISMADIEPILTPQDYVSAMEYEYAGMINALNYLSQSNIGSDQQYH